ncbi:hypothetical protein [Nonomuraea rhodomycinica]|uniref:Uncharacterized protein n=1 Tax=Nonomuraea rhodomycinica TaxID=1712872 RepID=A0A7Y6INF2_9ACTN|nr:hypothetical protein [Nonomuraea rhodomycinica]NUW41474.1 hypothetical protein [Nonomuraea rhodomycinica]
MTSTPVEQTRRIGSSPAGRISVRPRRAVARDLGPDAPALRGRGIAYEAIAYEGIAYEGIAHEEAGQ